MCFSTESSLTAYIIGSIASLYLLINGDKYDKHIGLFSLIFVQIQLAEFFMWLDQKCNKNINHYASIFAECVLYLQPISVIVGAILFKTTYIPEYLLYFFLLFYIIYIGLSYYVYFNKQKLCSISNNNTKHLAWDFINEYYLLDNIIYFIFTGLLWLFFKNKKGLFIFIFGAITLLFGVTKNFKFEFAQWESKWCFYSVLLPGLIIIYNLIYKK
tara:strand:- start:1133 stop:1774 length:642 start_codon:yes stop_codon:yes gene_type:complete